MCGYGYYERLGTERSFEYLSEAGFDAMDFSLYRGKARGAFDLGGDADDEVRCREIKAVASAAGVEIGQTHAPFGYREGDLSEEEILEIYRRSARATRALGADKMVVHPIKFENCLRDYRRQECFDLNLRLFEKLAPTLRDCGVKAMLENMFIKETKDGFVRLSPTIYSTGEELARAADSLGDNYGVCLDSGHALITGEDIPRMVRTLGKRIEVLHLHDNDHERDDHLPPYLGELNFPALFAALKEVGYAGNINFEIHFGYVPEEHILSLMRYIHEIGVRFRQILDGE